MRIDLHVHSDYSDGSDSLESILHQAHNEGIDVLSFVDHDTVSTYPKAKDIAEAIGIQLVKGIEISAFDFKRQRNVHVLGYQYQRTDAIRALTGPILERRHALSCAQIAILKEYGFMIDEATIKRSGDGIIYRQHMLSRIFLTLHTIIRAFTSGFSKRTALSVRRLSLWMRLMQSGR